MEEANISRIIHTLRKTLGQDENGNKFIETVATKGYRFVAEVMEDRGHTERRADKLEKPPAVDEDFPDTVEVDEIAATVSQTLPPEPLTEHKRPTRVVFFTVGFATAISLILLLSFNFWPGSGANPAKTRSITVLPLKPINTANRDEIYEIGIADSMIQRFSSMKGFVVRPLSATRKYADIEQDALAAGKEQRVDYVLASNYQLANGKIRVTSQLFNVATGQIEETYKSEKDAGDLFVMQDSIAGDVGNKLLSRFTTTSSSPAAKRGTDNEEAYRLYLQGMYLSNTKNQYDAQKAVENLAEAVRLDPNYALAWAGKAYAHDAVSYLGRNIDIREESGKSIEAINKSLALDPNLSEAHSALCGNKFEYEWNFAGAEIECRRAIELKSDSSQAHQIYSRFLLGRGRFDEAIAEITTAIDIEPASRYSQLIYGYCLLYARRYEEAAAQFRRMVAIDEDSGMAYMELTQTLYFQGKEEEAFEWLKKAPWMMQTVDKEVLRDNTRRFQMSGWQGILRRWAENFESFGNAWFHGAGFNAQIGNKDKAFEYLEKSFQRREHWMSFLEVDPRLDSLHDDPRFDDLVRRVGL